MLTNDSYYLSIIIWGITIAILFVITVCGMLRCFNKIRDSHKIVTDSIQKLLLVDMLARLNVPLKRYFQKTSEKDQVRHIIACQNCPNPEKCQKVLLGDEADPTTFCPNYGELKRL